MPVRVQKQPLSQTEEIEALRKKSVNTGAMVTFTGKMREFSDNKHLDALFLEHYPGMAESQIEKIIQQAKERWQVQCIEVVHRVGKILPSEEIVFVGVCSEHRREAFQACEFVMDYLKTEAPFWKKELSAEGESWVEAKASDADQLNKWEQGQ